MASEFATSNDVLRGLIVTAIVFIILDTLFLTLRSFSRFFVKRVEIGWDDALLWPGYALNIGLCALALGIAHTLSIGNPNADDPFLSQEEFELYLSPVLKWIYALGPLFALGYSLPKLSILLFYERLFIGPIRLWFRIFMAFIVMEMFAFLIATIFYCTPVSYYWTREGNGHCFDSDTFYRVTSAIKVVVDLGLVALPLHPLWKLQISKVKKIGLSIVFGSSVIGVIGGIIRFAYILAYPFKFVTPRNVSRLVAVIILEPNLFFIAACLPACSSLMKEIVNRPAVKRLFGHSTVQHSDERAYATRSDQPRSKQPSRPSDDLERLVNTPSTSSKRITHMMYANELSRESSPPAVPLKDYPHR